jgi:hypothetical protein
MRYSSALVLSTVVVGQATAANLHHRHASFHARRQAEAKRSADVVDWSKVTNDLKEVNWDEVNWSSVFNTPTPAPAPVAAAAYTPVPEAKQLEAEKPAPTVEATQEEGYGAQEPTTTSQEVAEPTSEKAQPTSAKAEPTSEKAKPTPSSTGSEDSLGDLISDIGDSIGDAVDDLMHGVQSLAKKLGCKVGKNDKSNNGGIWIGGDSQWKAEFINDKDEDAVVWCWKADGFSGMSINVNVPEVSVGIKPGQSVQVSFAPNVPAACAPAFSDTKLAMFGGLDNTWWEVTFGEWGAFDVSRNVNMKGSNISAKGSKCVSDMETCVFKCKDDSKSSCEAGTDYDLFNCAASNGGGGGYDVVMAGTGGGCNMGASGEHVKVVLS